MPPCWWQPTTSVRPRPPAACSDPVQRMQRHPDGSRPGAERGRRPAAAVNQDLARVGLHYRGTTTVQPWPASWTAASAGKPSAAGSTALWMVWVLPSITAVITTVPPGSISIIWPLRGITGGCRGWPGRPRTEAAAAGSSSFAINNPWLSSPAAAGPPGYAAAPAALDRLVAITGAASVGYDGKDDCCGGGLMGLRPDLAREQAGRKVREVIRCGADALLVACPTCGLNFSKSQPDQRELTILYFPSCWGWPGVGSGRTGPGAEPDPRRQGAGKVGV
jgi:hypothetical protein